MAADAEDKKKLLVDTFRRFDQNGDGVISRQELTNIFLILCKTGTAWNEDSIDLLMNAADVNKDGKIQYAEFVDWVMEDGGKAPFAPAPAKPREDTMASRGKFSTDWRVFLPERFEVDIKDRYAFERVQIGEGGYGKVFIAKDREFSERRVAVKQVIKTKATAAIPDALATEISVMKELDHPNVAKLLGTFEEGRVMYFIMELCEGGELFDRIIDCGHINETISADIIGQVSSALAYAHGRGIAHRDIKPENVVFCTKDPKDTQVKLIDWGLAFMFVGTSMNSAVGSFTYAAPEVITSDNRKAYSAACDLWSLGVLTYVMLCGKPPFWGTQSNHLKNARAERYPMSEAPWDTMNKDAKDFVRQLLRSNAKKRLPIDKVVAHPWLERRQEGSDAQAATSTEVLKNLSHFSEVSTFERMCITAVARQLDHRHLKDVHAVFRQMDKNGDGVLSLKEVSDGFKEMYGEDSDEYKQVAQVYSTLDSDGSALIDYTEFCAAGLSQKTQSQDEVLWAAFKAFDTNNSGYIEKAELAKVLDAADVQDAWTAEVCNEVSQELVSKFDHDGDGRISFEDWKGIMQACWDRKMSRGKDAQAPAEAPPGAGLDAYALLLQVSQLPALPEASPEEEAPEAGPEALA